MARTGDYLRFGVPSFAYIDGAYWTLTYEITFYGWMGILYATKQLRHLWRYLLAWCLWGLANNLLLCPLTTGVCTSSWYQIFVMCLTISRFAGAFTAGCAFYMLFKRYHKATIAEPDSAAAMETTDRASDSVHILHGINTASSSLPSSASESEPLLVLQQSLTSTQSAIHGQRPVERASTWIAGVGTVVTESWRELLVLALAAVSQALGMHWAHELVPVFPRWYAVMPLYVLITYTLFALVILSTRHRDTSRVALAVATLLATWPVRVVGDVSYAYYLMHQVRARCEGRPPPPPPLLAKITAG